ncbi:MAG: hypothetical protein MUF01_16135 [Bryobacterales bacterium]|nr:hypothetical protein [Bryobacterales bacterium]
MRSLLLVFLACALALAQIPTAPDPDEIPVYLPGGEEAGPSLPSNRGIGPIFSQNRLLRITPYLGVQGVYDTGLLPLSTNENGDLVRKPAIGIMATFGAAGSRPFRRSLLNLAYNGNVTHYPSIPFLSFSNHRMELAYSHSINRRITYLSNGGAIVMNTPFGGFGIPGGMPSLDANPTSEVFNTPIFSLTTQQSVNYQRTARLGITLGGGAFNTFRRSEALVSVQGVNATGTVSYRLSGRTTVAGVYSFGQFFFSNSYGGTNFHQANVELAHKLSKRTEIALGLGGVRIESQSLRSVPLDPIIASLLGRSTGIEAFYRKNYLPNFTATFRHSLRSVSFNAQASRMVNPGNGLVLTNQMTNASAGLSYSGLRRATLS